MQPHAIEHERMLAAEAAVIRNLNKSGLLCNEAQLTQVWDAAQKRSVHAAEDSTQALCLVERNEDRVAMNAIRARVLVARQSLEIAVTEIGRPAGEQAFREAINQLDRILAVV